MEKVKSISLSDHGQYVISQDSDVQIVNNTIRLVRAADEYYQCPACKLENDGLVLKRCPLKRKDIRSIAHCFKKHSVHFFNYNISQISSRKHKINDNNTKHEYHQQTSKTLTQVA
jgi:hypothetical protein